ncbi:hypothetical protein [Chitinophaga sancti]|uniref:hypothetical protein n=1 Tax=Chitinophaga sancti TaxID=1004 RepID=UPI003F7ACCA7
MPEGPSIVILKEELTLLDQEIFAGSGNIIKNEVLFHTHIHPLSKVGKLPLKKKKELIQETRQYSFDFLEWKKAFVLKKHWFAHTRKSCPAAIFLSLRSTWTPRNEDLFSAIIASFYMNNYCNGMNFTALALKPIAIDINEEHSSNPRSTSSYHPW